jgi:hypothetical protein
MRKPPELPPSPSRTQPGWKLIALVALRRRPNNFGSDSNNKPRRKKRSFDPG